MKGRGWWKPDREASAAARDAKPIESHLLRLARELAGVTKEELARRVRLKPSTIEKLERGKDARVPPTTRERLTDALGVSPATWEELRSLAEEIRGGQTQDRWVGPVFLSGTQIRRAREFGRAIGNLEGRNFEDFILRSRVEERAERDRETATQIGYYLRGKENLVEWVRQDVGCHLWSVSEWLCTESMNLASKDPDRAAEYAEAALAVAELVWGEGRFKARLLGYCWGHIGNILRVKNEFEESDASFAKCVELWWAGAEGDPYGLLDAGRLMGMEASLRREQGRFTEALRLLREAMPVATKDIIPYLRLNCGIVLEQMGDAESAIRVLQEATEQAPRQLLLAARFNVGVNLCHLGRYEEAEALLPEVVRLCIESENRDYRIRVRWLTGRVAAGREKTEEALGLFRSVQKEFLEQGSVYDAAIVLMDLAKIYLKQGETLAVKRLAQEMAPLFAGRGLHSFAQEALRLFEAAAVREAASVEFVARLVTYLERARRAHCLRFEGVAA